MGRADRALDDAYRLADIFESQVGDIHKTAQSADPDGIRFDMEQARKAMEIANRILGRLETNATTRSLKHVVLATTAYIHGIMSARPLACQHASADYVDFVNLTFLASSTFVRLELGSFFTIPPTVFRRFFMSFRGRSNWPGSFGHDLGVDLERDLSTVLFFFEAYMRPGILTGYRFWNPGRSHRFRLRD
ncbi:hypothetical protein JL101_002555 [Skermanella rosea]|uniref:hypothetical protein n=1 Tax=Skermanella rosea TaxID=1817965 RepID=UPI0019341F8C|nr:hypothetical protein [Skermanella rosea]UEM04344.1 hypothetical protein JL101_002555 [Skermanella rosea]